MITEFNCGKCGTYLFTIHHDPIRDPMKDKGTNTCKTCLNKGSKFEQKKRQKSNST